MLTLYYLENSRAIRIEWLLNELELDHETKSYKRVNGKRAAPEMGQDIGAGLAKSPALRDSDGDLLIYESAAIMRYLIARYGSKSGLLAAETDWKARAEIDTWISFAEGSLALHVIPITYSHWFLPDSSKQIKGDFIQLLEGNVVKDMEFLEATLKKNYEAHGKTNGEGNFLVGKTLTAADIQMAFSAEYTLVYPLFEIKDRGDWEFTEKWLRGLEARPAFQKALQVGEYKFVLPPK